MSAVRGAKSTDHVALDPFEQMLVNWWRWPTDAREFRGDAIAESKSWSHVAAVCWGAHFALWEVAERQGGRSGPGSARALCDQAEIFQFASDLAYERSQMVFVRGAT